MTQWGQFVVILVFLTVESIVYFWLLEDIANATMCHSVAFICSINDAKKKVRIYLSTWNLVEIVQK